MPDISALVKINHFLGNVDGVVADAFETVGDANQAQGAGNGVRVFDHETGQFPVHLCFEPVHFIVVSNDLPGDVDLALDKGVKHRADHAA